ncbi:ATP citrate lyase citrate-binding domain-containing protein [Bradyrhizobium sp. LTSP885]|uniref:ATP citrate lyase citrate-binding domain-containing protein n=1 Tax=Bradyrhizobium sp. LTSP885 TaxID=1619232 RepID=UPI001FDA230C|nr:ATP citrate lyase citrate-binding domain-containing protein [Bradyrhizobium sp. LTSP885]
MLYGSKLLKMIDFPHPEVLGPEATNAEIKDLIDRHRKIVIKPVFYGALGKKGKAGLVASADHLAQALREKERLFFAEHGSDERKVKASGVTYEAFVPSEHEVYVSISDSTRFRAPTLTITHHGGVDVEDVDADRVAQVPFDPLTGLKAFVISNALSDLKAPRQIVSPLAQYLPRLWDLVHGFGISSLEINPIRLGEESAGRLLPMACDFKCAFDRDDTRTGRLDLPADLLSYDLSEFEAEINKLRTHQGQSDVYVVNPGGTVLAPTFGGGANSLVSEILGDDAIISSDFGGNPPYTKMRDVARSCFSHWLMGANVLLIIGGKSNNTDIFTTFKAMADALRAHFGECGPTPLYVVVGRGGPNLVQGMAALRDTVDELRLPYRFFGPDSAIGEVVNYAREADQWMKNGGRELVARSLGVEPVGIDA